MSAAVWIRRAHRWVSAAFTLTVVANFVAMAVFGNDAMHVSITYAPLLPLALLLLSGLYLFALPYVGRRRAGNGPLVQRQLREKEANLS
jgi:peptidoglycan/LPS O-acetylase OafA/YrhL